MFVWKTIESIHGLSPPSLFLLCDFSYLLIAFEVCTLLNMSYKAMKRDLGNNEASKTSEIKKKEIDWHWLWEGSEYIRQVRMEWKRAGMSWMLFSSYIREKLEWKWEDWMTLIKRCCTPVSRNWEISMKFPRVFQERSFIRMVHI